MSAYRFEGEAQWQRGLVANLAAHGLFAAASGTAVAHFESAPKTIAALDAETLLWIDSAGALRRDAGCPGPQFGSVIAISARSNRVWILTAAAVLAFDSSTFEPVAEVALAGARALAADRHGGVWVLDRDTIRHFDAEGRALPSRKRPGKATGIAAAGDAVLALDLAANSLFCLAPNKPVRKANLKELNGPGTFHAGGITGNAGIVLITGTWDLAPGFAVFDAEGEPLRSGTWEGPAPELMLLAGDAILALFDEAEARVMRRFARTAQGAAERYLTPVLQSDTLAGLWQRAVVAAWLPPGATLELRWAATRDEGLAASAATIAANLDKTRSERLRELDRVLPWCEAPVIYAGRLDPIEHRREAFALPLSEVEGSHLWLDLRLHRNGAEGKLSLESLIVRHDEPGLMEYLPAIYRGPGGDGDGTLRRLVGVLEATFLGFDDTIGRLADRLDPERAEARWLPDLAALLGLPFDAGLSAERQRALVRAAPQILAGRGTVAGVRALLAALFPGRALSVSDRSDDFIAVTLGGGACPGTRLPGLLSGPSVRTARLNARLVLGRTALCSKRGDPPQPVTRPAELIVIIPASGSERRKLEGPVRQLLTALLPAGVRLALRWTGLAAARGGKVLGVAGDDRPAGLGDLRRLGTWPLGGGGIARLGRDGVTPPHRLT